MFKEAKEIILRVVDKIVIGVDDRIAGDGGASVRLNPEQQAQMQRWFTETRPRLKAMGIDVNWGDPHR